MADFGNYHLGPLLGRGGMGMVFRARQDPLGREVALKFLPLELLADEEFLDRFEREAQLMARLTHPGIARVFEAGISDAGRPFLAMELVAGEPVTAFVRAQASPLRARLGLFLQICEAIQHAHQRGVIHRDLKPSNVLACAGEAGPSVKVIDFGLARPSGELGADHAIWRSQPNAVGTPVYMSPEQAAGGEVDTRTDVYSLGVMLCELLTGRPPFEDGAFGDRTRESIARVLEGTLVPRPSELSIGAAAQLPAAELRGDLDAICLCAMARSPGDRYETVAALAEDIRRHLRDEPVAAMPPRLGYRLGKYARRHRLFLAVTTLVVVTLLAAVVFSTIQARVARQQRDRAEAARAQAERVKAFLTGILAAPAPDVEGREVRVVDVLAKAGTHAETDFAAQPEVLAEVRLTLGNTYLQLSEYREAEPLLRSALADHRRLYRADSPALATALIALGSLCAWSSRCEEALPLLREAVAILQPGLPATARELGHAWHNLNIAYNCLGQPAERIGPLREAIRCAELADGPESVDAVSSRGDLADALDTVGRKEESLAMMADVIARMRKIPTERQNLATMLMNWGESAYERGDASEAERSLTEAVEIRRQVFGPRTPPTAVALGRLAQVQFRRADYPAAEAASREALGIQREKLGAGQRDFVFTLRPLAFTLVTTARTAEARPLLTELLELTRKFAPSQTKMIAEIEEFVARAGAD